MAHSRMVGISSFTSNINTSFPPSFPLGMALRFTPTKTIASSKSCALVMAVDIPDIRGKHCLQERGRGLHMDRTVACFKTQSGSSHNWAGRGGAWCSLLKNKTDLERPPAPPYEPVASPWLYVKGFKQKQKKKTERLDATFRA